VLSLLKAQIDRFTPAGVKCFVSQLAALQSMQLGGKTDRPVKSAQDL